MSIYWKTPYRSAEAHGEASVFLGIPEVGDAGTTSGI